MDAERLRQIDELVEAAAARDRSERATFLDSVCGDDLVLRSEVESLLAGEARAETFLETPVWRSPVLGSDAGLDPMLGRVLGHYRIEGKLSEGGMGVVYRARDAHLERDVAIKVLAAGTLADQAARDRFRTEALSLSRLNHPNIETVYDFDTEGAYDFLVLEYVAGQPLSHALAAGPLTEEEVARLGSETADALAAAHRAGVIHRDLKPGNLMVQPDGHLKVLDFGLAKRRDPASDAPETAETTTDVVAGTLPYMAPEQLLGERVDERTDVYALGVVLYEMATGECPYRDTTSGRLADAILHAECPPPSRLRAGLSPDLEALILKCLAKDPARRYQSAADLSFDLRRRGTPSGPPPDEAGGLNPGARGQVLWQSPVVLLSAAALLAGVAFGAEFLNQQARVRWAREEALPKIEELIGGGGLRRSLVQAYSLAEEAEAIIPGDAALVELLAKCSVQIDIRTEPAGASIFMKDYAAPDDEWRLLGVSPIEKVRVPIGRFRWRIEKEGYETVLAASSTWNEGEGSTVLPHHLERELFPNGTAPPDMVWVPDSESVRQGTVPVPITLLPTTGFWLDRHEVTNRQFKAFVDAGGYRDRKYWTQPFIKTGLTLTWEQAMAEFRDASGRPGPATWELGSYPEGRAEHPVGGISWYEAAAYAEFVGKRLPTAHHWLRAAGLLDGDVVEVLEFGNFTGTDSAPGGAFHGLGPFGTSDMAGNVREWCWNPVGRRRYILGGGYGDPAYQLTFPNALDPFSRVVMNGVRCAKYESPLAEALTGEAAFVARDRRKDRPADNEAFQIYRDLYAYDKLALNDRVESFDERSPYWRRERVSFRAGYGTERVIAHVFVPRSATPPYQVVVFFPGSTLLAASEVEGYPTALVMVDRITRSGRALVLPAYKGTLERGPGAYYHWLGQPNRWKEMNLQWAIDLGRTIDYLETRDDLDTERLAFLGSSLGAAVGPLLVAVEPRLKAAILLMGGSFERVPPEVDPWNFAPRVRIPVLMLNGRDDFYFPLETSQLPLFRLIGTADKDKKLVLYDGAHDIFRRSDLAAEMVDWLDRYLGPVNPRR